MPAVSKHRRPAAVLGGALAFLAGYVGCTFPEHTFIPDDEFFDASVGAQGGVGGVDAGVGGTSAMGGTSGAGGSSATGGVGATGGSSGTAGEAGSSGSGGVAGSGAVAGSAGSSGSGGIAGSAGTAGAAGASGSSGSAGSAGTGGAAGSGGAAGAAGSAGSGGGGNENCTNGVDDDGDTDVDCADSDCVPGHTCAPTVPSGGWAGPVARWQGTPGAEPDCLQSGGYPTLQESANDGISAPAPTCQSCQCGPITGSQCSQTVDIEFWDTASCDNGCWGCTGTPFTMTSGGACVVFGQFHGPSGETPVAAKFTQPTATGGSCTAMDVGSPNIPAITWSTGARSCGDGPTGGGGCGSSKCMPVPQAPFASGLCIFQAGDLPCPIGPYSNKFRYFRDANDTRACSACSCGAAQGETCTGTVRTYTNACTADLTTIMTPETCTPIVTPDPTTTTEDAGVLDTRGSTYTAGTPQGGSCPPQGGQASGGASPSSPVTFCCL